MNVDFIIVGQGLAGTLLASAFEDLGKTFCIVDDLNLYAASRQAAGIINPITGRRYVKSWNYDALENIFVPFYKKISNKLNKNIFDEHDIILCLSSVKEENDLLSQASRYTYIDKIKSIPFPENIIANARSSAYSLKGYKLNIVELCNQLREIWAQQGKILNQRFDYKLIFERNAIIYHDIRAKNVVFCEGAFIDQNPYFKHAPVISNKGQFLMIDKADWKLNHTVKDKIIISPVQNGLWVGATYEWSFETPAPNVHGRNELSEQLNMLLHEPYTIKNVFSGLRPTTKNRRPLILRNPVHPNLWTINGFGTKGSSLGPFIINQFLRIFYEGFDNEFEYDNSNN